MNTEVNRGIELLDENKPGWEFEIDTDSLNISSFDDCVLGQLYSSETIGDEESYVAGRRILGIESGKNYGFVGQTTPEWIKAIESKREEVFGRNIINDEVLQPV